MAYTTIDNPELYFQTKLYTGNGSTQSITGVGFQPDWLWIKKRSESGNHRLVDSVRGATKELQSDNTDAEATTSGQVTSFDSDGFSLGTSNSTNKNSITFASWCWKMGTAFSNDASATGVGTIDSTGSVSTTAGQSIISYSGTGSAGTIAHGLGSALSMIIQKNRTAGTHSWNVFHKNLTSAGYNLNLNGNYAEFTSATTWNSTAPTSSVFSVGTDTNANESGSGHIAYCFAEKKGYSKFGSYTGNGNADGTFVYTGFKPAFILLKHTTSQESWHLYDGKRANSFNPVNGRLQADSSGAEYTGVNAFDFVSNGFKLRDSNIAYNQSGDTFIYMAFAESPFVNSNGVPNNGR